MNISEHKIYSYSQSGLLLNRYKFSKEVKKYGEPLKTSPNGRNFVFKKTRAQIKEQRIEKKESETEFWNISLFAASMFGITFIKKVNIKDIYEKLDKNRSEDDKNWFDRLDLETDNHPNLEFNVSDNRDIMVKLTSNGLKTKSKNAIDADLPAIFVFIANNDHYKKYDSIK